MGVASTISSHSFVSGGGLTPVSIPFPFADASHVKAYRVNADGSETLLVSGVAYAISGDGRAIAGTYTPLVAVTSGLTVRLRRMTPPLQSYDPVQGVPPNAQATERALDDVTMGVQDVARDVASIEARAIKFPIGESAGTLGNAAARASRMLGFTSGGAVELLSYDELADRGLKGDPGAPGGNFLSAVSIADHGAIPNVDSADASTANIAAFSAAVTAAVAAGVDVFVPSGTYWVTADNGFSTGLQINLPDNGKVRIIGEGGSVIKRRAAATMAATSPLVWMWADTGVEIEWWWITFDGNEANCQYDAGDLYAEEQSSNIKWRTGSGTPKALRFFFCDVAKGRVGDGYHANVTVDHFMALGCYTTDTSVRRVRADFQFSRYATYDTILTGCEINSLESEPSATPATAFLQAANVMSHSVLDIAGDTNGTSPRNPIRVTLSNVHCPKTAGRSGLPYVNFWRVHGELSNCHIRGVERIQRSKLIWRGGTITVKESDVTPGLADAVQIWHDQAGIETIPSTYPDPYGNFVEFNGVIFRCDSGVTTGSLLLVATTATVAGALGPGAEMVTTRIINCHVENPVEYVISASRAGDVIIERGRLRASVAIILFNNDTSYCNRLHLLASTRWNAPALLAFSAAITVTTGVTELNIAGEFNAEVMSPVAGSNITSAPSVVWRVGAVAHVASDPAGRIKTIPGLTAKQIKPVRGAVSIWHAGYGATNDESGYGGTTWNRVSQALLRGTASYNPPSLAAGSTATTTVTITGAAIGDHVFAGFSLDLQGVVLNAAVTATDTVTVTFWNPPYAGGAIDLASGTVTAMVRKLT